MNTLAIYIHQDRVAGLMTGLGDYPPVGCRGEAPHSQGDAA